MGNFIITDENGNNLCSGVLYSFQTIVETTGIENCTFLAKRKVVGKIQPLEDLPAILTFSNGTISYTFRGFRVTGPGRFEADSYSSSLL